MREGGGIDGGGIDGRGRRETDFVFIFSSFVTCRFLWLMGDRRPTSTWSLTSPFPLVLAITHPLAVSSRIISICRSSSGRLSRSSASCLFLVLVVDFVASIAGIHLSSFSPSLPLVLPSYSIRCSKKSKKDKEKTTGTDMVAVGTRMLGQLTTCV